MPPFWSIQHLFHSILNIIFIIKNIFLFSIQTQKMHKIHSIWSNKREKKSPEKKQKKEQKKAIVFNGLDGNLMLFASLAIRVIIAILRR